MKQRLGSIIITLGLLWPWSQVAAEKVLTNHAFAWSNMVGYINFGNLSITDQAVQGSAWSESKGFIIFSPPQGRVLNDGTGNLSGSAWGEQLGWIDFSEVNISATGNFSGRATGPLVGTITFDCPNFCDVQTDWRPSLTNRPAGTTLNRNSASAPGTSVGNTNTVSVAPVPAAKPLALFDISSNAIGQKKQRPTIFIFFSLGTSLIFFLLLLALLRRMRERTRAQQNASNQITSADGSRKISPGEYSKK